MPSYSRTVQVPGKTAQELYEKVSSEIGRFLEKASIGNFDVNCDPQRREVNVKSSMFSATLFCREGELSLDGKLSLMATPFRSKIDEGIDRWLTKAFNLKA